MLACQVTIRTTILNGGYKMLYDDFVLLTNKNADVFIAYLKDILGISQPLSSDQVSAELKDERIRQSEIQ